MNIIILARNREKYISGYHYPQITGMVERLIRADKEGESYVNDYLDPSDARRKPDKWRYTHSHERPH